MTIADAPREEGRQQGALRNAREVLPDLPHSKFGRLASAVDKAVRTTDDLGRLNAWIVRAGMASTLEEVGIGPGSSS